MGKLYIRRFAGIEETELEWGKINILIGPQATGKSVIIKLTYLFNNFFEIFEKHLFSHRSADNADKAFSKEFLKYFPPSVRQKRDFEIRYDFNPEIFITVKKKNHSLTTRFSDKLKEIIQKIYETYTNALKENGDRDSFIFFLNYWHGFEKIIIENELPYAEQIFIPAGRSFFANIQSNIFGFLSEDFNLDPFLKEFGKFYERLKRRDLAYDTGYDKNLQDLFSDTFIEDLFFNILKGKYITENDEEFILHSDGRKVNLLYASSGQQEIVPLLRVLEHLYYKIEKNRVNLYIEEPEAHLFPEAQHDMVKILARVFNTGSDYQYFITTHSPYILTAFNNLLYAGILEKKIDDQNEVYRIIPKKEIIAPGRLKAFGLDHGGKISLIMDDETGLIDQNVLDGASEDFADEFEKLLQIEFPG